jgi:hypothetical protein
VVAVDVRRRALEAVVDLPRRAPACLRPEELALEAGTRCVGDGAFRYRRVLEAKGALIAPDDAAEHVPSARFHAQLAHDFGPPQQVEPIYLRVPDAERTRIVAA